MPATRVLDCDAFCTAHESLNLAKPRRDMNVTSVTFFAFVSSLLLEHQAMQVNKTEKYLNPRIANDIFKMSEVCVTEMHLVDFY